MSLFAHYNDTYKKTLALARILNAPDPAEIFKLAGEEPSKSALQSWRVGRDHKQFRPVSEDMLLAYLDGLIQWADENAPTKNVLSDSAPPAWAVGLSNRTAQCLVNEGFTSKKEVRAAFTVPDFDWQQIPNFGRKCNDEVLAWLNK